MFLATIVLPIWIVPSALGLCDAAAMDDALKTIVAK